MTRKRMKEELERAYENVLNHKLFCFLSKKARNKIIKAYYEVCWERAEEQINILINKASRGIVPDIIHLSRCMERLSGVEVLKIDYR